MNISDLLAPSKKHIRHPALDELFSLKANHYHFWIRGQKYEVLLVEYNGNLGTGMKILHLWQKSQQYQLQWQ
jgi:hypothetical protein